MAIESNDAISVPSPAAVSVDSHSNMEIDPNNLQRKDMSKSCLVLYI